MSRLLLHVCCGPCSIYPFQRLTGEGYELAGFFYNPNIQPADEFNRRKNALVEFAQKHRFAVTYFDYLPEDFFSKISPSLLKSERCFICWEMRLSKAAFYAKENNFDYFSTTLLISPYQDQQRLKEIGETVAVEYGVKFFYQDFRIGFSNSQKDAKEYGLYRQKYCGCIYSQLEQKDNLLVKGKTEIQ